MAEKRKIWHWIVLAILSLIWGLADNEHFSSSMLISVVFIFAGVYIINRPDFFKKRRVISDE
jgi:drug/metabolite transporter (DMT)-like permease